MYKCYAILGTNIVERKESNKYHNRFLHLLGES